MSDAGCARCLYSSGYHQDGSGCPCEWGFSWCNDDCPCYQASEVDRPTTEAGGQ